MTRAHWRVQQRRSGRVVSETEENLWAMMLKLVNDHCVQRTHIEKVKREIEKDHWKMIRDVASVPIFRDRACVKFYGRIWRWNEKVWQKIEENLINFWKKLTKNWRNFEGFLKKNLINFEKKSQHIWWNHEHYLKTNLGKLEEICEILKKI